MSKSGGIYPASAPSMPDAFWVELADENPLGAAKITAQDAADWFYLKIWSRYKTYPYGRSPVQSVHVRHIARWWSRIDGQEIIDARQLRRVKLGFEKPRRHRPQPGSVELPQEPRNIGEAQKQARLRLVEGSR